MDQKSPLAFYTTATATPAAIVQDMKKAAMDNCPRTCGLCCQTSAYSCANVAFSRLNCATITSSQCLSAAWRTIIATDCPSACGFCNSGGCVDAVMDCANDRSICTGVGMQDFVNTYCQRTCNRCASSTTRSSVISSATCTSYIADSSTNCRNWSTNGFCTNTFYTLAQRRSYCATTCRIC
ncbi:Protein CBG22851 [Caenorhabditis briggsae]|uniref:Protein CBG22851 n=1 Tax=Caenorhabditis briggsae TaxID=6238 RepID=A8Y375_CAEBR|nr:Protein CBG22851 [Caenorhabditis briggsae]CAP39344.2 Protein CBG22851 [Caenorhabditis briggsae]